MPDYDVEVVMPVYNEADCIGGVLEDWAAALGALGLRYRVLVLNDGSRDRTAEALARHSRSPNISVVNKQNSGHGPTLLQGYRAAVQEAEWVFQVDSDNEMQARHFNNIWSVRHGCDAVIGVRDGRVQPLPRKLISALSRLTVALLYGSGVQDVNCPFRLLKSKTLAPMLARLPDNTFAPNVIISGFLVLWGKKVLNVPIPHSDRQTGEVSIKKWRLLRAALLSLLQTIRMRFAAGRLTE